MKDNSLFTPFHFGFITGRSRTLQLLHVIEKITSFIESGDDITIAYIWISKKHKFDTVPHRRLLQKLAVYHLDPHVINWIKDFLSDRTQSVVVNGTKSSPQRVTSGVPQSSPVFAWANAVHTAYKWTSISHILIHIRGLADKFCHLHGRRPIRKLKLGVGYIYSSETYYNNIHPSIHYSM